VFHRFNLEELRAAEGVSRLLKALGVPREPGQVIVPAARNAGPTWGKIDAAEETRIRDLIASAESNPSAIAGNGSKWGQV
jgi:hypothetical protein